MTITTMRRRGRVTLAALVISVSSVVIAVGTAGPVQAVPPSNDSFATPTPLAGPYGVLTGSTVGATKEAGEPDHAGVLGNKSVWFTWTAPQAGPVVIRTGAGYTLTFDSLLAVYQGTAVDSLTEVASNDDQRYYDAWSSRVRFEAEAGATYRIAVDAVAGKSGVFTLSWGMRPANDDFAAAEQMTGATGVLTADNSLARRQAGEPRWQKRSLWYRWTAPRTGHLIVRTGGSLFDTLLAVYRGSSLGTLRLLARNDDYRASTSRVRLPVRHGRTYRIAVAGYGGDSGPVVLRWRMP